MARKMSNTMADALMLVGGGVVGAGLALLLAPQTGKKSRRDVMRFGKEVGNKGDKMMRQLADNMTEFAGTFSEMGEKFKRRSSRW